MAHVREEGTAATEQWRLASTVGRSVGWPEEVGLALAICPLEAIDWETATRRRHGKRDCLLDRWRLARTISLNGFGGVWKRRLLGRVERSTTIENRQKK